MEAGAQRRLILLSFAVNLPTTLAYCSGRGRLCSSSQALLIEISMDCSVPSPFPGKFFGPLSMSFVDLLCGSELSARLPHTFGPQFGDSLTRTTVQTKDSLNFINRLLGMRQGYHFTSLSISFKDSFCEKLGSSPGRHDRAFLPEFQATLNRHCQ
jgi:hypothetical protein